MNSFYPSNKAPLPESAFSFLPLGAIKPKGWLKRQLEIQAAGLTGNLPKFWKDLGPDSGWLGGDGESWERGPYYMDGLIPIAYLLEDDELIKSAKNWVNWTLENQKEDGAIGPEKNTDFWPIGVMLKVLTQYQEVTGDPRVIPLMEKFCAYMAKELPKRPIESWAKSRWADTVVSIHWLYNRNGDKKLLKLAKMLMDQGYDWTEHFASFKFTDAVRDAWNQSTHVVNNAMAVKTPGVQYEITGDDKYWKSAYNIIEQLDRYHGQVTGVFSGDEHYAGKNPSQGTELCAVVEYMFSLENLIGLMGDVAFADRLEKITYNALPATFTPDMWHHQYDQQANQPMVKNDPDKWVITNKGDSTTYGLEPQFGCCTANMHQGWPKFVSHTWMATPDDGLAAIAYAPCSVTAKVRGGAVVTVDVETNYPFEETVKMTIKSPNTVSFPLKLRIPTWANGATIKIEREEITAKAGEFKTLDREWKDGDTIELMLPMEVVSERRFNGSISLSRGPLVYSLVIGEKWVPFKGRGEGGPKPDYEVYPTTKWNYGLVLDEENLAESVKVWKGTMGDPVFSPAGAPLEIRVKGKVVPEWQMQHSGAGILPQSPIKSDEPVEELRLIPYGCTNLRITEFPLIEE